MEDSKHPCKDVQACCTSFFFPPRGFQSYSVENPNSKRKAAQRVDYQTCSSDPCPDVKEVNLAIDRAAQWKRKKRIKYLNLEPHHCHHTHLSVPS